MFSEIKFEEKTPIITQIKDYIKRLILKGMLQKGEKLPSTREMSQLMKVSRNSILRAYEDLEDDGFVYTIKNVGVFVEDVKVVHNEEWKIDWSIIKSAEARVAEQFDILKNYSRGNKAEISFRGLSPDRELFDVEGLKRAFLNIISLEEANVLNYGYAKGYKPLIDYIMQYLKNKGIDTENKEMIITNGFTEGFDIVLGAITEKGDRIVCENPTHNTAIKIMKLHQLDIVGVDMDTDGINVGQLRKELEKGNIKAGYLIPSYHNPTGIVMPPEKRVQVYEAFKEFNVPIIEDGFNEELRYSGAHIAPISAFCGNGNGVVYIGSFSKVLFPGLRIGWVLADKNLISSLESIKKSRNIHTSFLDQAILFQYLHEGNFDKFIKKSRRVYGERYNFAMECAEKYISCKRISGDGGMYIFIELAENIDSEVLLDRCQARGVSFMPGKVFYVDDKGRNTIRIGFAKVKQEDIEKGFKIIGEEIKRYIV